MYVEVRIVELVFFLHLYMGPEIEIISPGLGGQLTEPKTMHACVSRLRVCMWHVRVCMCVWYNNLLLSVSSWLWPSTHLIYEKNVLFTTNVFIYSPKGFLPGWIWWGFVVLKEVCFPPVNPLGPGTFTSYTLSFLKSWLFIT